jgi:hypothetical protein
LIFRSRLTRIDAMRRPPGTNGVSATGRSVADDPRLRSLRALAAEDPSRVEDRLLGLLRATGVTPDLVEAIARQPAWIRIDRIRTAIVLHPATPRALAMGLLSLLRWHDLARVAAAPGLGAPLRSSAEKILLLRLPELALGERVTLARTATPRLLRALAREPGTLVVRALCDNPRFQVEDALAMLGSAELPPAALRFVAESPRFAASEELRLAIAAHACTPSATAMRLVQSMDGPLLKRLLSLERLPGLVAMAARRRAAILGLDGPSNDV